MHMTDCLLSPAVGVTMFAASAAAVTCAAVKIKKDGINFKKAAVSLAAGAAILAAQAVNYAIVGTGSSGHILGAVMLAALVGAAPAMLVMASVLTVQCFLLGDGGVLALGANIFNVGVIPCLIVYPLIFKPLIKNNASMVRTALASVASGIIALQLGAFGVVLMTQASGITALPFVDFTMAMLPIHLAIGLIEGAATAAVLCLIRKTSPALMSGALDNPAAVFVPVKKVIAAFAVSALIAGLALPPFASSAPDGLEWSIEKAAGSAPAAIDGPVTGG
ncbi:MAG: energy-coupling factor ABC transporter permease [Chitinispirillia bacterium]|nr:energy-coupling factor ABC transporter permease [Chitinispirillia bacterium]MCL2241173.1 energy-coupling factor ABC transporter permease [Chitinispirillia bacterium]